MNKEVKKYISFEQASKIFVQKYPETDALELSNLSRLDIKGLVWMLWDSIPLASFDSISETQQLKSSFAYYYSNMQEFINSASTIDMGNDVMGMSAISKVTKAQWSCLLIDLLTESDREKTIPLITNWIKDVIGDNKDQQVLISTLYTLPLAKAMLPGFLLEFLDKQQDGLFDVFYDLIGTMLKGEVKDKGEISGDDKPEQVHKSKVIHWKEKVTGNNSTPVVEQELPKVEPAADPVVVYEPSEVTAVPSALATSFALAKMLERNTQGVDRSAE